MNLTQAYLNKLAQRYNPIQYNPTQYKPRQYKPVMSDGRALPNMLWEAIQQQNGLTNHELVKLPGLAPGSAGTFKDPTVLNYMKDWWKGGEVVKIARAHFLSLPKIAQMDYLDDMTLDPYYLSPEAAALLNPGGIAPHPQPPQPTLGIDEPLPQNPPR